MLLRQGLTREVQVSPRAEGGKHVPVLRPIDTLCDAQGNPTSINKDMEIFMADTEGSSETFQCLADGVCLPCLTPWWLAGTLTKVRGCGQVPASHSSRGSVWVKAQPQPPPSTQPAAGQNGALGDSYLLHPGRIWGCAALCPPSCLSSWAPCPSPPTPPGPFCTPSYTDMPVQSKEKLTSAYYGRENQQKLKLSS